MHWFIEIVYKIKFTIIKIYISTLYSIHHQNYYKTNAFKNSWIDLIFHDIKWIYEKREHRIHLFLTIDILECIIREINNNSNRLNIKVVLYMTFVEFLRAGEFTWETWDYLSSQSHLARKYVIFNVNESVTFIFSFFKTDSYDKDTAIHLFQANFALCFVQAFIILFCNQFKLLNDSLFSRIIDSFNRVYIIEKIKELLLRSGISNINFSDHSLRKETIVTMIANDISKENIKLLDRWKSDAIDIYINELAEKDHISKLLQLNTQLHYKTTLFYSTKT